VYLRINYQVIYFWRMKYFQIHFGSLPLSANPSWARSPQGIFHLIRGTSENLIIKILAELLRSMCSRLFFIIASAEHIAEGAAQLSSAKSTLGVSGGGLLLLRSLVAARWWWWRYTGAGCADEGYKRYIS